MISQNISTGEQCIQPLVSVIMNCYNSEKYLREAIDSVLAQAYQNWEIIFWDNQSTDTSADIFKRYQDSRMKYFYAPEHTTLGQARNLAVEQAMGEWLGFLDCDDIWIPEKLYKQVAIINEVGDRVGLVYGQMGVLVAENQKLSPWAHRMAKYREKTRLSMLPEGDIFERLLADNFVPLVSALIRHAAFYSVGGINPSYKQSEDFDLFVKISEKFQARAAQEVIAIYRIHEGNATQTQQEVGFYETLDIIRRYMPSVSAKKAMCRRFAQEAFRRFRAGQLGGLLHLSNECGVVSFAFWLPRVCIIHFKNRFIRRICG